MAENIDNETSRESRYFKTLLQIVAIAIFALLIVYFMRKYADDISNVQNLSLLDILLISVWSFVSYTAYAYAVYMVLVDVGLKGLGPFGWLRVYFVSRLVNLFVTQGGNVFRLVLLKKKYDFSYTNSIGVTVFLIWINALIALLASIFALAAGGQGLGFEYQNLLGWSALTALMTGLVPLLIILSIQNFRDSSIWRLRVLAPLGDIADFFVTTLRNVALFSQITSLSIVHFLFFVGVNYFCFQAIGEPVGIVAVCLFTTAFVFTRYINIVPGNLGVSELVGGLVSEQLGIGFGNGVLVSGVIRIIEVMMIVLIGLTYGNILTLSAFRK